MSYLEKYVRQYYRLQEKKEKQIGLRLSTRLHDEFLNHCDRLGLSISEAITILMDRELEEAAEEKADRRRKRPNKTDSD